TSPPRARAWWSKFRDCRSAAATATPSPSVPRRTNTSPPRRPMIDLSSAKHHPALEEIVEVICNKTQTTDKGFFRVAVAFFFAKMASSMRAKVYTKDRGEIPVNVYALALANSGYGKGHSVNIMELSFLNLFKRKFLEEVM